MVTPAELRSMFENRLKEGIPNPPGDFHPQDLERLKDDKYLNRIIAHHENNSKLALDMLWDIMIWRKTVGASDITENTVRMDYINEATMSNEEIVQDIPVVCIPPAQPDGLRLNEGDQVLYKRTKSGELRVWLPDYTPRMASPEPGPSSVRRRPLRARRYLPLQDAQISDSLPDSGSEDEDGLVDSDDEHEQEEIPEDTEGYRREPTDLALLLAARRLREILCEDEDFETDCDLFIEGQAEACEWEQKDVCSPQEENFVKKEDSLLLPELDEEEVLVAEDPPVPRCRKPALPSQRDHEAAESSPLTDFDWSPDYESFQGKEEIYMRSPGPKISHSDPTDIFLEIWDLPIMECLVEQTNKYARQYLEKKAEHEGGLKEYLMSWQETTVEELYRLLALLCLMAVGKFDRVAEYWRTWVLGMPEFRNLMSKNRFIFLMKYLHFVDNDCLSPSIKGYDRKIFKIQPIVEYCNKKFSDIYTPQRHISLDESLLLWKGRLSFKQCNRTKAARFGIKSFDLCEATTGYLLKTILYAGAETSFVEGSIHPFKNTTSKTVLKVMDGYLDVGHCLVMDNWYNQLPLTRYLKSHRTDVIGTLRRRCHHVPTEIKDLHETAMESGQQLARHCGDISVLAWKDVKLVTTVSTYHNADRVRCNRAGKLCMRPKVIAAYNKFMGGVDLKDQKLSSFHFERKRGLKWYIKVFRRLLNTTFLNAYIIYTKNPMLRVHSHREFRVIVAEGILSRFKRMDVPRPFKASPLKTPYKNTALRLDQVDHFPDFTKTTVTNGKVRRARLRCIYCKVKQIRTDVTTRCSKCDVPLCLGACYKQYHTVKILF